MLGGYQERIMSKYSGIRLIQYWWSRGWLVHSNEGLAQSRRQGWEDDWPFHWMFFLAVVYYSSITQRFGTPELHSFPIERCVCLAVLRCRGSFSESCVVRALDLSNIRNQIVCVECLMGMVADGECFSAHISRWCCAMMRSRHYSAQSYLPLKLVIDL